MMATTDFARLLTRYFSQYLPAQRNLSERTIQSYRDTFKLLLQFGRDERDWMPEHLTLDQIDRTCLEDFLDWLETTRHCGISTRNQRLAALRTFFRWVAYEAPEFMEQTQRILGMAWKKRRSRSSLISRRPRCKPYWHNRPVTRPAGGAIAPCWRSSTTRGRAFRKSWMCGSGISASRTRRY